MLHLDLSTGRVDLTTQSFERSDGATCRLTAREAATLTRLARTPNADVSRDDLLHDVWGDQADPLGRVVDTTVSRLRRKLELGRGHEAVLVTSRSRGYRLVVPGLRRPEAPPMAPASSRILRLADREIDLDRGLVRTASGDTLLSTQQLDLLLELVKADGRPVDIGRLARVLGLATHMRRSVATAVYRLRLAVEPDPDAPVVVTSVRGRGYRLAVSPETRRSPLPELTHLLWELANHVGDLLGVPDCVIYLRDGAVLAQVAAFGPKSPAPGEILDPITLRVDQGIVGLAARRGGPVRIADTRHDDRYVRDCYPGRSELAVPILFGGETVGVIDSESVEVGAYGPREEAALQSAARLAAAATADLARLVA